MIFSSSFLGFGVGGAGGVIESSLEHCLDHSSLGKPSLSGSQEFCEAGKGSPGVRNSGCLLVEPLSQTHG